ncbi:amino acid carrier protein [Gammaproteobacteria bacterium]|nr:amino acid carrier protein [Gammaproteobacteria bacterium]
MIIDINNFLWSVPIPIIMLLGGGLITYYLKMKPQRHFYWGLKYVFSNRSTDGVSPFKGLMIAMAGTVGTGNIAGVATAITLGGPGALFYIWVMGFFALAVKYFETYMGVTYRQKQGHDYSGGPSYYIQQLMPGWWGLCFSRLYVVFLCGAGLGIGAMVQANSVSLVIYNAMGIPHVMTGIVLCLITAIVVYGGVTRVANICGALVPVMVLIYFILAVGILMNNYQQLPHVLTLIFSSAFSGHQSTEGFMGASAWAAMHYGFSRGIFANEAGMGSSAIAHACVHQAQPESQSYIAILGTCIDTFIVCTLTGLVVICSNLWVSGDTGAILTTAAIVQSVGMIGYPLMTLCLVLFAFSTILSWGYYTRVSLLCFWSPWVKEVYAIIWLAAIVVGAVVDLVTVWEMADLFNGLMLIVNMVALLFYIFKDLKVKSNLN